LFTGNRRHPYQLREAQRVAVERGENQVRRLGHFSRFPLSHSFANHSIMEACSSMKAEGVQEKETKGIFDELPMAWKYWRTPFDL
jgi:hypothetical protein